MPHWGSIAAGLALGIVLFPLLLWVLWKIFLFVLKRKLSGLLDGLQGLAGSEGPPLRINLVPLETEPEWAQEPRARATAESLDAAGFQHGGDFSVPEAYGSTLRAYLSADRTSAAFLCKHPAKPECFLDLAREFVEGDTISVSDAEEQGLERCPRHQNIKLTGQPVSKLVSELQNRSEGRQAVTLTLEQLAGFYQKGYAAIMDWRVEKGGVTREEMLANAGREMSEEEIPGALEQFRRQNLDQVQDLLSIRYAEQAQLPAPTTEEPGRRLVFAHDRLFVEDVRALVESTVYWLESPLPQPSKPGREGFKQMLNHLPPGLSMQKIAEVTGSIPADVYLAPTEPDGD